MMEIAKGLIMLIHKLEHVKDDFEFDSFIEYIEDRPFNDKRYFISNEKLKNLGWKVTIPFLSGIEDLIQNY